MTGQELAKQYRIREWAEMVTVRKRSGMQVDEWCAKEGISRHAYFYRLKQVREYAAKGLMNKSLNQQEADTQTAPEFVALPVPRRSGSAVTIHIGSHIAEVHNGADLATMEGVLRALTRL